MKVLKKIKCLDPGGCASDHTFSLVACTHSLVSDLLKGKGLTTNFSKDMEEENGTQGDDDER